MSSVPLLQCAMDYISLWPALAMSLKVATEVDIIEIGTPLCKAAGLDAIRAVRELLPDKLILADFKTQRARELLPARRWLSLPAVAIWPLSSSRSVLPVWWKVSCATRRPRWLSIGRRQRTASATLPGGATCWSGRPSG